MGFLLVLAIFVSGINAEADVILDRTAKIYELGKRDEAPLFLQKSHLVKNSAGEITQSKVVVSDLKGNPMIEETAELKGTRTVHQRVDHFQSEESYDVDTKDDTVQFKIYQFVKGKREKLETDKTMSFGKESFITGPGIGSFIIEHWNELFNGKKIHVRFGVPSAFFIAALVDPIYLTVDTKTKEIQMLKGRSPLFKKVGNDLKPLDIELVYDASPATTSP
jgi:hypothetical protein